MKQDCVGKKKRKNKHQDCIKLLCETKRLWQEWPNEVELCDRHSFC